MQRPRTARRPAGDARRRHHFIPQSTVKHTKTILDKLNKLQCLDSINNAFEFISVGKLFT